MWGKEEEIGALCVAFDALYNRFICTESLLYQPFHLLLVETRLVIYLVLTRWEYFLNGVQRSIRESLLFSRITICCLPLLLQQSEAPRLRHLVFCSCKKTGGVWADAQGCFVKVFWSLKDQHQNWEMAGQCCFDPLSQWSHRELSRDMWVEKLWQSYCSLCLHFLSSKHHTPFGAWAPHMHPPTVWKGKKVWDFSIVALCYKFLVYAL